MKHFNQIFEDLEFGPFGINWDILNNSVDFEEKMNKRDSQNREAMIARYKIVTHYSVCRKYLFFGMCGIPLKRRYSD